MVIDIFLQNLTRDTRTENKELITDQLLIYHYIGRACLIFDCHCQIQSRLRINNNLFIIGNDRDDTILIFYYFNFHRDLQKQMQHKSRSIELL